MTTKKSSSKAKKAIAKVKKAVRKVVRSSKSGKFVPKDFAKSHPTTTVTENIADKPVVTTTVAPVHAELAQAAEQNNKEMLAEIAKHQFTVPEICERAWDEIRGSDPPLAQCVRTHVEKLLTHAQGILNGGAAMRGDTQLARFEQAISRLKEN